MPLRAFVVLAFVFIFSPLAHAQSFDGKYEGKLLLTKGGAECGEKSEVFALEVNGKTIRIVSQRGDKPFAGEIAENGQLSAKGSARGRTLEWRAQILATKTGLGSMLETGSGVLCQFLVSLKRN